MDVMDVIINSYFYYVKLQSLSTLPTSVISTRSIIALVIRSTRQRTQERFHQRDFFLPVLNFLLESGNRKGKSGYRLSDNLLTPGVYGQPIDTHWAHTNASRSQSTARGFTRCFFEKLGSKPTPKR